MPFPEPQCEIYMHFPCRKYLVCQTAYLHTFCTGAPWNFLTVLCLDGCSAQCATAAHHLLPTDILRYHEHFTGLSPFAKKQWLLDYFVMNSSGTGEQLEIPYYICGKRVCFQLWIKTLGISQSHFYNVRSLFLKGHKRIIQQVVRTPLQRTSEAVAWMDSFFTRIGDRMPDRPTIHLPSSLSKISIYQNMTEELQQRGKSVVISQSQFFDVWKTHFGHVTIPKVHCRLSPPHPHTTNGN